MSPSVFRFKFLNSNKGKKPSALLPAFAHRESFERTCGTFDVDGTREIVSKKITGGSAGVIVFCFCVR